MNVARRALRRLRRLVVRARLSGSADRVCPLSRFGSDYGGWAVVLAPLSASSVAYSVGVGEDISFDLDLIRELNLNVHAFDPTPRSVEWVRRQRLPAQFRMHAVGIAAFDGDARFFPPANPAHVSCSMVARDGAGRDPIVVPVRRLSTIMRDLGHRHVDLLKLDIEGAEYEVLDDMLDSAIRPTQLLVEFHYRFAADGIARTRRMIERLRAAGYDLVSVSRSVEEFGFLLKDAG